LLQEQLEPYLTNGYRYPRVRFGLIHVSPR
jgi:hypothetical protein